MGVETRERSAGVVVREAMEWEDGSWGSVEVSIVSVLTLAGFGTRGARLLQRVEWLL